MNLPNKNIERKLIKAGHGQIIGVDEVGMGCLAGPVVVCAAYFDKRFYLRKSKNLKNVNDSKLLSSKKRGEVARELIKNKYFKYKISLCQPKTIDRLNIHKASKLAMRRAVESLAKTLAKTVFVQRQSLQTIAPRRGVMVLVDGLHEIPNLGIEQRTITKGDSKIFVIACASIVAKVY